jgi:Polysaccharide deacetylase
VLDLMDKHGIKLSSFMIGRAVENQPDLAREIVRRGHEAAAHGREHSPPSANPKSFCLAGKELIVCGHALFLPETDVVSQSRFLVSRHRVICNRLCNRHCLASA